MPDEGTKHTKRTSAQERLRASELRYRRLFEAARDGILLLDAASRRITDTNPYMVELLRSSKNHRETDARRFSCHGMRPLAFGRTMSGS